MIRSAVTVSLVPQARGGPFIFWDDLPAACRTAAALGFDAIELFAPSADAVSADELRRLLEGHGLQLAAVGTGAGMVVHQLSLTDADSQRREAAKYFIRRLIDFGGPLGAPAIIGSMQGRWNADVPKETAIAWLGEAVGKLGDYARQYGVPLLFEPLNRYETNLVSTIADGVAFLVHERADNTRLLADLFHMNIEEADVAAAIRTGGSHIGHVHFVDSNRQPAGRGHIDFAPIAAALKAIRYDGYASAEALPIPDSHEAARLTMEAFRRFFRQHP